MQNVAVWHGAAAEFYRREGQNRDLGGFEQPTVNYTKGHEVV